LGDGKLLVPFFTAGFPDFRTSLDLVEVACDCGADLVELGMPFSDPLADGPLIQYSSRVALANGINLRKILTGVEALRARVQKPIILMGYYNPVLTYGQDRFLTEAAAAGVDGFIIPDLPVEEAAAFRDAAKHRELSVVFLVAPTSSEERIALIDRRSTDFVYAVTVTGVTGTCKAFDQSTDRYLRRLRTTLRKRFVAGFGVSSPEIARRLTRYADGVVIGSALVGILRAAKSRQAALRQVARFLKAVRKATRG